MRLKRELTKTEQNAKISSSVAAATFQMLSFYLWLAAAIWGEAGVEHSGNLWNVLQDSAGLGVGSGDVDSEGAVQRSKLD